MESLLNSIVDNINVAVNQQPINFREIYIIKGVCCLTERYTL